MRVRPSFILKFALLSAPVLNAAGEITAGARNAARNREHPVAAKTVKAAAPARLSHVPDHAFAVHSSSREATARWSKEPSRKETARAESVRGAHSVHSLPTKEEHLSRSEREYDRRHASVGTRNVKPEPRGQKVETLKAAGSKTARVEPEKVARVFSAPMVKAPAPEETGPAPSEIESDPEAAKVNHDRKVHHSADEEDGEPRKANPSDFMNSPGKPAETSAVPPPGRPVASLVTKPKPGPVAAAKAAPVAVMKAAPSEATPPPIDVATMVPIQYRGGRLVMPPALKGSHEILLHQNEMADEDGLGRVQDDNDLEAMRVNKLLLPIPVVQGLQIDERLPANRRYTRPWTAQFLAALARAHYQRFHTALQVNSAVRTVEFQQRLLLTNGNAAPAEGETASPHLTGQAVDLAKKGLSMTEIAWLRGYLLPLVQQGKVDVEEEFQQACFHVSVYKKYLPEAAPKRVITPRRGAASALATALP